MGAKSDKEEPKLSDELAEVAQAIRRITAKRQAGEITADDAAEKLYAIKKFLESSDLKPDVRRYLKAKWATADQLIFEIGEDEREAKEKAAQERIAQDALKQLAVSEELSELVPLFSEEFGDAHGKNYVAALLDAGERRGYRKPKKNLNLDPISSAVHNEACTVLTGVSNTESRWNGLIMRVREESAAVVRLAHLAGYDIYDATVRSAMANLARAIALTLDSDSGAREYGKFDLPRGMAYNVSEHSPGHLDDVSRYTGDATEDPKELLEKNEQALLYLRQQFSRTIDDSMKVRLTRDIKRLEQEMEKLRKKLSER